MTQRLFRTWHAGVRGSRGRRWFLQRASVFSSATEVTGWEEWNAPAAAKKPQAMKTEATPGNTRQKFLNFQRFLPLMKTIGSQRSDGRRPEPGVRLTSSVAVRR